MSEYYCIFTEAGSASVANAVATQQLVELSDMAVGDGNGATVVPQAGMTTLTNEVYRAGINTLYVDPEDAGHVIAELVIPSNQGGWTIRECGLFDNDGNLFAVGNLPESVKPTLGEGAGGELTVRMHLTMTAAEAGTFEIKVDPTVVLASRQFVADALDSHKNSPGSHDKATTTTVGFVELATNGEVQAGTDSERAITPSGLSSRTATEARTGIAEIATQEETDAGVDDSRIVTPAKLAAWSGAFDGGVSLKSTRSSAGAWTITGLAIGKPLFITMDTSVRSSISMYVVSGSNDGAKNSTYQFSLQSYAGFDSNNTTWSAVLVPTATSVTLQVSSMYNMSTLRAYQ